MRSPPGVYLVDDQAIVRASLERVLTESGRFRVVGQQGDARAAIAGIREVQPDVVLLDLSMPGVSGLEALPEILAALPRGVVVIVTDLESPEHARAAIEGGARGYLSKADDAADLLGGLDRILAGERFVSARVAGRRPPEGGTGKAGEADESWFRSLVEGAPDAIVGVDAGGRILLVNAQTERLFGYSRVELLEQPVELLVPTELHDRHVEERERYFLKPSTRPMAAGRNLTGRRKDGSTFPVEISLSPVRTPNGLLVMSVVRDVTERKEAERRELTMLRALATIGESAAILAHEIKNPITAVNAALKSVGARLGLADREVLDDLVERMRRLEMMIRRTLSFVKPLDLHKKACRVNDLFEHALDDSRGPLSGKAISVRQDDPSDLECVVDPQLMREVLANLVTNAAEAMDAGTITLGAAAGPRGEVVLTVEDDGPGMPATMRNRPIQPFVTSKQSGTGLGLTICRKIVEEHGGRIAILPADPRGTRVRIEIPAG